VKKLDVDFAVGGMLKYLLGTAGLGFLYVRNELIPEVTPTNSGWFAQANITAMDITANRPSATARRFEAGTPAVVNCYAVEGGIEDHSRGRDGRYRGAGQVPHAVYIWTGWRRSTGRASLPRADEQHGPMICVRAKQVAQLFGRLTQQDIVDVIPDDNLRATFHFTTPRRMWRQSSRRF